jgi:hypothetical protein
MFETLENQVIITTPSHDGVYGFITAQVREEVDRDSRVLGWRVSPLTKDGKVLWVKRGQIGTLKVWEVADVSDPALPTTPDAPSHVCVFTHMADVVDGYMRCHCLCGRFESVLIQPKQRKQHRVTIRKDPVIEDTEVRKVYWVWGDTDRATGLWMTLHRKDERTVLAYEEQRYVLRWYVVRQLADGEWVINHARRSEFGMRKL